MGVFDHGFIEVFIFSILCNYVRFDGELIVCFDIRVSTFLISMLLIVYGSFRSLNMEREARERQERDKEAAGLLGTTSTTPHAPNSMYLQCIFMKSTATHAFWEFFIFLFDDSLLISRRD